ncbi:MAG: hypothetical protein ACOYXN_01425 [Acidobacteriota bacterium]
MDGAVKDLAAGALRRLSEARVAPAAPGSGRLPAELRITKLSLAELSRLAYLQAGDPLVDQVLAMLQAGRPVFLDRPAVERVLGLSSYPPRLQEQFARWFIRISGMGVALVGEDAGGGPSTTPAEENATAAISAPDPDPAAPQAPRTEVLSTPDRQILREILGEAEPEAHACWIEPGKACCGSGRCKTLGF